MKWTAEKPTVPGWYWAKRDTPYTERLVGQIIWVYPESNQNPVLVAKTMFDKYHEILDNFKYFQGPIQPEEGE